MKARKGEISGMLEESVYAIDFFKLSKMRRPSCGVCVCVCVCVQDVGRRERRERESNVFFHQKLFCVRGFEGLM